jgi:hypothetical protein
VPLKSETRYTRKGKVIIDLVTGENTGHKSLNAAKKASRELQQSEDGGLGRGILQLTQMTTGKVEIKLDRATVQRMRTGR